MLLSLFPFLLEGQVTDLTPSRKVVVEGKVTSMGNMPVSDAAVIIGELQTWTAKDGTFKAEVPGLPVKLLIKHLGYQTYQTLITQLTTPTDTLCLVIQLEKRYQDLEEVKIVATKISRAYPKDYTHIIDYDFFDGGMRLLLKEHKKYLLREVDENNDIVDEIPIRAHPKSLFHDCLGNTHIVYRDSVFQLNYTLGEMKLLFGISRLDFGRVLEPCVVEMNDRLVMSRYTMLNQAITYNAVSKKNGTVELFYKVYDRETINSVREYYEDAAREEQFWGNAAGDNSVEEQEMLRNAEERTVMAGIYTSTAVYAPLIRFRDSLFLFDHNLGLAVVFDRNGKWERNFPIVHHYSIGWDNEIIADEESERLYARCQRNCVEYLLQFSPDNGTIIREIRLDKHPFAEHIRIKGNYVYYIYHHSIDYSINYLYKHRIN
jgi:hypothetical protein